MAKNTAKSTELAEKVVADAQKDSVGINELVAALVAAINVAKPVVKKTASNRTANTPWSPKPGEVKPKLKRPFYQHGILVDPEMSTSEQILLMNKVRPGLFCDGHVRVTRRRDKGVDISYSIKTAAQRLRLVNGFGVRTFDELLQRCIDEAENPKQYAVED